MNRIFILLMLAWCSGCASLAPKPKEFFQDKVKEFPTQTARESETQKQTVELLRKRTVQTAEAATEVNSPPEVLTPAREAAVLAEAVSVSVGPPVHPPTTPALELAQDLKTAVAKLDRRLTDFQEGNDENVGKKIEGTGLFQVPYFVWLGGVLVLGFVGFIILTVVWSFLKMYALSNPPLAAGLGVVQAGSGLLRKTVGEVLKGGEKFKEAVQAKITAPEVQKAVLDMFREHHERSQSADTQELVRQLTNKGT